MKHHILTTGISLLTNFQKHQKLETLDAALNRHSDIAKFLEDNPCKASAELNSLNSRTAFLQTAQPEQLGVTLIFTETKFGKAVSSLLENFLKPRLARVNKIPVRGIDKPEHDFEESYAQQEVDDALDKLRMSVANHITKLKKDDPEIEVQLNCTGGYKSEVAVLYALGRELRVPVYYLHDTFRCAVTLN